MIDLVRRKAAHVLGLAEGEGPDVRRPLSELGLDSFMTVELAGQLELIVGRKLAPTIIFQYPSLAELGAYLAMELVQGVPPLVPLADDARDRRHQ